MNDWREIEREYGIEEGQGSYVTQRMAEEISRLRSVIAKELTENDELGAEFVYVQALKSQLEVSEQNYQKLLQGHLEDLKALQPDGPVWKRLAAYQNELGEVTSDRDLWRELAMEYREALKKIDDPIRYHHWEDDAYTRAGCFQFIAQEALKIKLPGLRDA